MSNGSIYPRSELVFRRSHFDTTCSIISINEYFFSPSSTFLTCISVAQWLNTRAPLVTARVEVRIHGEMVGTFPYAAELPTDATKLPNNFS